MSDWPNPSMDSVVLPTHINTWMDLMSGRSVLSANRVLSSSSLWSVANLAVFIPFYLPWPYYAARAFWANGSATGGNSDIGIYTPGGARLWSAGSTANVTNGVLQYTNVAMMLAAGRYFMAFAHSVTTTNHVVAATGVNAYGYRAAGCLQQGSALPLPANATFALGANPELPLIGITRTPSGF